MELKHKMINEVKPTGLPDFGARNKLMLPGDFDPFG